MTPIRAALRRSLQFFSALFLLAIPATTRSQALDTRHAGGFLGRPFAHILREIQEADSTRRRVLVEHLHATLRFNGQVIVEDSTVHFVYIGPAAHVAVPGDLNGWNPEADTMQRVAQTQLFVLSKRLPLAARCEYKFVVDSAWILDPINQRRAIGGYGPNSEVCMPLYRPPKEVEFRPDVPHGILDTLSISSTILRRTHPVFVYLPPDYGKSSSARYATLYVNDGGEYISLALMTNVLDNMLADGRIPPIVAVFVDPRTDLRDPSTNKRMLDYTMSDSYVRFLAEELRPIIASRYNAATDPARTGIMGASLGGLIATYAAFTRPDVFGLSAAQSPAYWWANDSLFALIANSPRKNVRFFIDTGTIHDAQEKAYQMKMVIEEKGYPLHYEEHPEGHNWFNWRARISSILEYFFGTR